MPYSVILVGSSGLIGSNLLSELIQSEAISEILLLVRRSTDVSSSKVKELIVNFEKPNSYSIDIQADIIYSCLGTTKSETPNSSIYRQIDSPTDIIIT